MRKEAGRVLRLAENLLRGRKRKLLDPLTKRLARSIRARFTAQKKAVIGALRVELTAHMHEAFLEADRGIVPAAIAAATAQAIKSTKRVITAYKPVAAKAYGAGASYVAGSLAADLPRELAGFGKTAEQLELFLDSTTTNRIDDALAKIFGEDGLSIDSALELVGRVMDQRIEQSDAIATHEVSGAFHQGQSDGAKAISTDTGDDVLKQWDCEDDACDECLDCEDEGPVEIDYVYPVFDAPDPPGHLNCRCSLSYSRADQNE